MRPTTPTVATIDAVRSFVGGQPAAVNSTVLVGSGTAVNTNRSAAPVPDAAASQIIAVTSPVRILVALSGACDKK